MSWLGRNTGKAGLGVDADSNANLDLALGTRAEKTIGSIREYLTDNIKNLPAGMSKETWVEMLLQQALVEEKGFDLVSMGRPEGPGCYCYLNNIFRRYLDIMTGNYDYVVMDNEAGMEHLSRRTTRDVEVLLIISDATQRGIVAAERIAAFRHELDIHINAAYLILNNVRGGVIPAPLQARVEQLDLPLLGAVPSDEKLVEFEFSGRPLVELGDESPVYQAVAAMMREVL